MRWRAVAWLWPIVVGGCFDPQPPANLPCGPMMTCPTGQTCVADICRADEPDDSDGRGPDAAEGVDASSVDGSPTMDTDGDGIVDAVDNCAGVMNSDQHDEDADADGDACDNCPHVANPDQSNALEPAGQADTVGDACDPRPDLAGDSITAFYPFDVMPGGLMILEGQGMIDDDQLAVTAGDGDSRLRLAGNRTQVTIEIAGVIDDRNASEMSFGVTYSENGGEFHSCGFYDFNVEDDYHAALVEYFEDDYSYVDGVHLPNQLEPGPVLIRGSANPATDEIVCVTTDARGTFTTNAGSPALQLGNVGIGGFGIPSYHLRYLVVFEH